MPVIEINKNPSRRDLAIFGLLLLLFAGLVGAGLYFRSGAHEAARIVWMGGAALVLLFFAAPPIRRPIYLAWIYATFPIGFVLSHVILGAVFYLVFTPLGLVMRLFGFDPLRRRFDRAATSYWVERDARASGRYFNPY
jgi:hypothetical protein